MSTRQLNNIPGGAELWKIGSESFVVYYVPAVPGQTRQVPLIWKVHDKAQLEALVGPGKTITYDKTYSKDEAKKLGTVMMGSREEIINETEHPFRVLVDNFKREAATRPWLRDAEVFALVAGALIEGRTLSEEELKTTSWWRTRTEAERNWAVLRESDPAQAARLQESNRIRMGEMARQYGAMNVPASALNAIADQMTRGLWSQDYVNNQLKALADPYAGHRLDELVLKKLGMDAGEMAGDKKFTSHDEVVARIAQMRANRGLDPDPASDAIWAQRIMSGKYTLGDARTRLSNRAFHSGTTSAGNDFNIEKEREVEELVRTWLGPTHGWSKEQIARWAGTLRNDPSGRERLEQMLSKQRLALWGEYADPTLTYEDIAAPWRSFMTGVWGQAPDETSDLFQRVVKLNDSGEARQLLMQEGLNQGVKKVVDDMLGSLTQAFGSGISRDAIRN